MIVSNWIWLCIRLNRNFFFGLVMTFYLGGWGVILLKYKTLIQSMWSFTSQCLLRNLQGILKCAMAYFLLLLFSYFNRFFVCDIKNITIRYLLRERERANTQRYILGKKELVINITLLPKNAKFSLINGEMNM